MRWQDIVLASGSLLLAGALVPTACLSVFAVVYGSLSLWYSTGTTALTSGCWWTLAYQRGRLNRAH
jgi:hypothetical protein